MSNGKWSEIYEHGGVGQPVDDGLIVQVQFDGQPEPMGEAYPAEKWHWSAPNHIIAYRYRIEEPTKAAEGMHPDLEWLARNVSEWKRPNYIIGKGELRAYRRNNEAVFCEIGSTAWKANDTFNHSQWLQARQDLGLVMTEEEEAIPARERPYSRYFKDVRHINALDVYRVVDLFECEKHGHPISHAVKKLLLSGVRTGGKDVEKDVDEAIDSLIRWKEMREEDRRATS